MAAFATSATAVSVIDQHDFESKSIWRIVCISFLFLLFHSPTASVAHSSKDSQLRWCSRCVPPFKDLSLIVVRQLKKNNCFNWRINKTHAFYYTERNCCTFIQWSPMRLLVVFCLFVWCVVVDLPMTSKKCRNESMKSVEMNSKRNDKHINKHAEIYEVHSHSEFTVARSIPFMHENCYYVIRNLYCVCWFSIKCDSICVFLSSPFSCCIHFAVPVLFLLFGLIHSICRILCRMLARECSIICLFTFRIYYIKVCCLMPIELSNFPNA